MNTSITTQKRCLAFAIASLLMASAQAQNAAVTVSVDANSGKRPISPYIYGVAFGTTAQLSDLNVPINRYGGNATSAYNWNIDATNHAQDFYFESIPNNTPFTPGQTGDTFISTSKAGGAQAMLTIPMLDYVATLGANRGYLWSFSQSKYGAQTGNDAQYNPDAGNGILSSTNNPITYTVTTNPLDANVPAGVSFQKPWVQHLISTWGLAASGGLQYYILDNEHSIWQSTHQDVHPIGPKMTEISSKMISYSSMIKALDPNAIVIGPEEWGWSGYFFSGYDQQEYAKGLAGCPPTCPDKAANGNMDYMPWLLSQMYNYKVANGKQLLDVFSLHYYPQGDASGDQEFSNDVSTTTELLRNKSTRSLWDPNYVDASWESTTGNGNVELIPRMLNWVATYDPGIKIAITEYNWGAEPYINGATTQADIYGIFGREGLDYGTRWTTPDATTPTYLAMKMYRNYDGKKSGFGDTSVTATVPDPDDLSAFAATRSADGALTVMVISKVLSGTTPVTVNLANFTAGTSAQEWQLTSANAITQLASVPVSSGKLTVTVPAQSISLFVVPAATATSPIAAPSNLAATVAAGGKVTLSWKDNSDNEQGFEIDRAIPPSTTFGPIGSVGTNVTQFVQTGLASGTYQYRIYAYNETTKTDSTVSNIATATVTDGTGPITAPSNLAAAVAAGGKVNLSWTDNSNNEQGFEIDRATSPSTTFGPIGSVAANVTQFAQTGLAAGTYQYRIYAYNETTKSDSTVSNIATATVTDGTGPIATPSNLTATVAGGQVTLSWQDNSNNEQGFEIDRAIPPSTTFGPIGSVTGNVTQFVQTGLAAGTYQYRIYAYNETTKMDSAVSNIATAVVQ